VTALLLIVLAALQESPDLLELRTVTDGCARSGCWLPLKVRVGGPAGFEGEISASSDSGFRVTRPFRIHGGGPVDLLLPVVVLAKDAKVEVALRGPSGVIKTRMLTGPLKLLDDRERLVLVDPRHPEYESLVRQELALPGGARVRCVASDPADWNEAADLGALEAVDGVVASEDRSELTMTVWRALGGALVTQPRRDLLDRLAEPAARFPSVDPVVGRFAVNENWIPRKRDSTLLFIVIYGFGFFVAVYVTGSRKGAAWLVPVSALGVSALFLAAFAAFYPKGNLAIRTWQGIVDAPEAPVAISISALWGGGPAGEVEFGRILKPVHPTALDAVRRPLDMRLADGRWSVRGTAPGDPTRFVTVERLQAVDPFKVWVDAEGKTRTFRPGESDYFLRLPRKNWIRPQDPGSAAAVPAKVAGLIESRAERAFRVAVGQ